MNQLEQFLTNRVNLINSKGEKIIVKLKIYFTMNNVIGFHHKKQDKFMDEIIDYFLSEKVEILQLQGDDPGLYGIVKSYINHVELSKIGMSNSECKVLVIKDAGFINYETGNVIKKLLGNIDKTDFYIILCGPKKSNWGGIKKHLPVI